jgi:hypothetical protein
MSARCLSGIIFMLTLGGIWLGALLRRTLPRHHLNEHAKDVVHDAPVADPVLQEASQPVMTPIKHAVVPQSSKEYTRGDVERSEQGRGASRSTFDLQTSREARAGPSWT